MIPVALNNKYPLRILFFLFLILTISTSYGQKKLFPKNHSDLTGIELPEGSKQDTRMLSVGTANMLMEMVSKKAATRIRNTEVFYLPVTSKITAGSITSSLQQAGWNILPVEGEPEYNWLQKDGKYLLGYFSITKKQINLYFAETEQMPANIHAVPAQSITQSIGNEQPTTAEPQLSTQQTVPEQGQTITTQQTTYVNTGFAFTTTNFDDGWTSTIQEDWVEVVKENIKVLLHYPKEGTVFPADPGVLTNAAWNILVAPRYSQLTNYKTAYVEMISRPYFGMGTVTENNSGRSVFVVLFRKGAGWMEVISPDALSFTREFGFNPETIRWGKISDYAGGYVVDNSQGVVINADDPQVYNKLDNMFGRNKFAVAASDLDNTGRWNANYASNTFYYNYYTGNSAGMSTFSASEWYEFSSGNKYHWEAVMTNSGGGVMNAAQSKSDGTFKSLNNWQIYFSNIGGKEKTFDVYFTAIKGGRVLWVNDANYPGSGIFTGLSRKK